MPNLAGEIINASDEPDIDMWRAYVAAANVSLSTTVTAFSWTKQSTNGGNIANASGNAGFTASRTGLYLIGTFLRTDRDVAGDAVFQWRLNAGGSGSGGTQMAAWYGNVQSAANGHFTPMLTFPFYMTAADTAECFHSAGGAMSNFIIGGAVTTQAWAYRIPGSALTA